MKLRYALSAQHDLETTIAFIARDNPFAAARVRDRIEATALGLLDFPSVGRRIPGGDLRAVVVRRTPYLLIYRVEPDAVLILRVWHAARGDLGAP